MKKEELIKENGRLSQEMRGYVEDDRRIRMELSKILRYQKWDGGISYNEPNPMTWIQIAFAMGELRADANYSCLLEGREMMRKENEELKKTLDEKKHI